MPMNEHVHVRQGLPEDLDNLTAMFDAYRRFYGQAGDPHAARVFLKERMSMQESEIFLAVLHGNGSSQVAGFMQMYPSFSSVSMQRLWILNDLFVVPHARNRGVGRALLERAREHARATRACRVVLETAADNAHAQGLYESFGFQRDGVFHYALPVD